MPNGETIDVLADARLSRDVTERLVPSLAAVAKRSDALYTRMQPIAPNYFHYENGSLPLAFASDSYMGAPDSVGILRFQLEQESAIAHNRLLIMRTEFGALSIVRDYKVGPNVSHMVEILAPPAHSSSGYDYGHFAVSVFRRIWNGGEQGRAVADPEITNQDVAKAHIRGVRTATKSAEAIARHEHRRLTT